MDVGYHVRYWLRERYLADAEVDLHTEEEYRYSHSRDTESGHVHFLSRTHSTTVHATPGAQTGSF